MKFLNDTEAMIEELERVYVDEFPDMEKISLVQLQEKSGQIKLIRHMRIAMEKMEDRKKGKKDGK